MEKENLKRNVSRIAVFTGLLLFTHLNAHAGAIFGDGVKTVLGEVRENFAWVVTLCSIVFIGFNLGNFFGEGSDWKKGVRNIIIFAICILVSYGFIKWVSTQSI